jgi:hypothetical protein
MSDNNGWLGKPGVPLNPERDGWHWLMCPLKHDVFPRFWRAAGEAQNCRWTAKWLYSRNDWNPKECTYLAPCLTPAEVDARLADALKWRAAINDGLTANCQNPIGATETPKDALHRLLQWEITLALDPVISKSAADLVAAAHKEWLAELNHDTDALMEAARQSALAECIAACDAIVHLYRVKLPGEWKDQHGDVSHKWQQAWEGWAEIAEDIAKDIRALSDTPPDMVLVPREPTSAMIQACLQAALDFMAETKTTEVHPGQTYPSPSENARRCWRAMVKAAEKGEGDD